jgi:hypothetical protein
VIYLFSIVASIVLVGAAMSPLISDRHKGRHRMREGWWSR